MLVLIVALLLSTICLLLEVIKRIVANYHAHKFFQNKSPKLPLVPNPTILMGNASQTIWHMKNCNFIDEWHRKLGKTFGYYVAYEPYVSTTDIDLIKRIEIDEANKHLDRVFTEYPIN